MTSHTETIAAKIIASNAAAPYSYGMVGSIQLFERLHSAAMYKEQAAKAILTIGRNRKACKEMGRNWHAADAYWLERAAYCRRQAAAIIASEKKGS